MIYDQLVSLQEFRNALVQIHGDIEDCIEKIDKADLNRTVETHMQAALAMSGLEIKFTNFAESLRERFR